MVVSQDFGTNKAYALCRNIFVFSITTIKGFLLGTKPFKAVKEPAQLYDADFMMPISSPLPTHQC